jgi:hypothetical protein
VTKRFLLNPMSAHFVAVKVPASARALELIASGVDGPDPLQTLLLGVRRGKNRSVRSLRVAREVNPCAVTFPPAYGTFVDTITVNFRSRVERIGSVLVVANRTNRPVNYTLAYRTLTAPVASPSPSVPWNKPVDLGAKALCAKELTGVQGSDGTTDAEVGAPELGALKASLVSTPSMSSPLVAFAIDVLNRRELNNNDNVALWIDTDRNTKTGCDPYGAERMFLIRGLPMGPDPSGMARCVNGQMTPERDTGVFESRFDEANGRLLFLTRPADLDGKTAFNFRIDAWWREEATGEIRFDSLPDEDYLACFPACASVRFR